MDWTNVTDWLGDHGWKIIFIFTISVVVYFLLRHFIPPVIKRTVLVQMRGEDAEEVKQRSKTLSSVLVNTSMVIIGVVAAFMILTEAGVDIGPALLGFGIVGLAIGFGAQSLIKDLIAGIFILLENQYCVGDWIQIGGVDGLVEQINLRRTILRDLDGTVHNIPNGSIGVASNYTKEWGRVNMMISVGYGEDIDYVMMVIDRVCNEMVKEDYWNEIIISTPQALRVESFGDSGIDIRVLGDTKQMRQWEVMGEIRRRIKRVFDEEGIEIPWPHTKLYLGEPLEHRMVGGSPKPAKAKKHIEIPDNKIEHDDRIAPPGS